MLVSCLILFAPIPIMVCLSPSHFLVDMNKGINPDSWWMMRCIWCTSFHFYCLKDMADLHPHDIYAYLSSSTYLDFSAACALASIFAPTLRIFIAARSIPPFLARSYIFKAVSRLSAFWSVVVILKRRSEAYLIQGLLLDWMRSILSALPSMEGVEDLLQDHLVKSLMLIWTISSLHMEEDEDRR